MSTNEVVDMTKLRDEFATKAGPMLREMTFLGRTRRGQPASRSRTVRRSETRTSRASTRSSRTAQSRSSAAPRRDWRLPTRRRRPAAGRRPPLRSTWPGPQRARRSRISRLRRQGRAGEEGAGGSQRVSRPRLSCVGASRKLSGEEAAPAVLMAQGRLPAVLCAAVRFQAAAKLGHL